jgi:hypothetical protein
MLDLVMQAAQTPFVDMLWLSCTNSTCNPVASWKIACIETFEKITAIVAEDFRLQQQHIGNRGGCDGVRHVSGFRFRYQEDFSSFSR